MAETTLKKKNISAPEKKSRPAGFIKISDAVKSLLTGKAFNEITWGEIAREAGVSEALIYQHFKDRRGLLYHILSEYIRTYQHETLSAIENQAGALNKLKILVQTLVSIYNDNRVFARLLLLEVRSYPDFFQSEAYGLAQELGNGFLTLIEEGIESGEIRTDVPPKQMRQVMIGAVELAVMPKVVFNQPIDPVQMAEEICSITFNGIINK